LHAKHCISITERSTDLFCVEIVAVYCEIRMKQ